MKTNNETFNKLVEDNKKNGGDPSELFCDHCNDSLIDEDVFPVANLWFCAQCYGSRTHDNDLNKPTTLNECSSKPSLPKANYYFMPDWSEVCSKQDLLIDVKDDGWYFNGTDSIFVVEENNLYRVFVWNTPNMHLAFMQVANAKKHVVK